MHGHPTLGVKNAKPRLSSRPDQKIGKLSEEYLGIRNRQMDLKAKKAAMELAVQRGEVVSKALVERQAAYLLVALRQRILSIPQTYSRRLLGINDVKEMNANLREMSLSMLEELRHLPERVIDPNWLQTLENELS